MLKLQNYSPQMAEPIPLHGTSLHDGVAVRLRDPAFQRRIAPGSYIDKLALAAQWQISRTPRREALKVPGAPHARCRW